MVNVLLSLFWGGMCLFLVFTDSWTNAVLALIMAHLYLILNQNAK